MFFSHVAMSALNTMNRVLKMYKFAYGSLSKKEVCRICIAVTLDPKEVPGHTVSFSGYPAALSSADDYSLMSSGLVCSPILRFNFASITSLQQSIETTIAIFNESLYQNYISPVGQIHCWVRSFISNALAKLVLLVYRRKENYTKAIESLRVSKVTPNLYQNSTEFRTAVFS